MGREFNELFDEWSHSYDQTVTGHDPEYEEVFIDYDKILKTVAEKSTGTVLEFGVGTGNLTAMLNERGLNVFGIEPSEGMRTIAKQKLKNITLLDGDFLDFPKIDAEIDTIVSTYAFHHLTDAEKETAIQKYSELLKKDGRIVFADTVFSTEEAKQEKIRESLKRNFHRLAEDLQREYYTTIPVLQHIFEKYGFEVSFIKLNPFVWLMDAQKKGGE
ncbi:class I SAM-dependent methyltransferase [Bacillus sp. FJAT-49736]|uniref:class I SAM-dependent methyltransferase n=1 Tax=Bacillus sp. FJAT-49736 TaxID=2833582 RepID=UPI001BC9A518|nr:class I SAM-dependent methyltransferase [Bacillus sp. FJAT-49736]MBS4175014.1 methyltransferase domain-containing protein [Bacillus sp. FJAT-49736]